MITLQQVMTKNSSPTSQTPQNSLQLLVNRFAYRYDADIRSYVETTLLRLLSGGVAKQK